MRKWILGYYLSIDGKSVDPDNGMRRGDEFMRSLVKLDLADEYRLWMLPAITERVQRWFPNSSSSEG